MIVQSKRLWLKWWQQGREMVMNDCRGSCPCSEMGILWLRFKSCFLTIYSIFSGIGKKPIFHSKKLSAWQKLRATYFYWRSQNSYYHSPPHPTPNISCFSECPSVLFVYHLVGIFVHMCAIFKPTSQKHCKGFKVEIKHFKQFLEH